MPTPVLNSLGRVLGTGWRILDASRRALLNLLLLALLAAGLWALLHAGTPALQPKTALVLELSGRIAEQRATGTREGALRRLGGEGGQARLRDVLAVLDAAALDGQVTQVVLLLDDLAAAGLPTLREIAAALDRFKASGKPVLAWGSAYDQRQYFLAAHASEVWMHPMGAVSLEGYGRYRSYYKDLLDRLGLNANVVRAGKFKNAGETYSANAPSAETLQSDGALYQALWASWTTGVEKARKLPAGSIARAIDALPASLEATDGDAARWALQAKWVDALKTGDELRAALLERGAASDDGKSFRQVSFSDYLGRLKPRSDGDAVGVIVAEGLISGGQAPPGRIGGLSTAALVRQAREDEHVKALVLRVDSPGGSAFGSELVRRELELTRKAGKPVVVSMGDVAASGGYWIAMSADELIADEATITGSIGVIAMLPTAQGAMDKLGVHAGGVTTTWLGHAYDVRLGVDPRYTQLVQATVDALYRRFTASVASARRLTPERVDAVAQGRVWAGRDALERGLVDRLGSYGDALQAAAARARLPAGFRVQVIEAEPGRLERLLQRLGGVIGDRFGAGADLQPVLQLLGGAAPQITGLAQDLQALAELNAAGEAHQPYSALAHCMCSVP